MALGMGCDFHIDPRDIPPAAAARRLGKTLAEFDAIKDNLFARGFPQPDPDTGNYDLDAINRWCDARHPHRLEAEQKNRNVRGRHSGSKAGSELARITRIGAIALRDEREAAEA